MGVSNSCTNRVKLLPKISTRNKHYTVLGLTNLADHAIMCIVIFTGVEHIPLVKPRLDLSVPKFGEVTHPHYFCDNNGPGECFPGGPSCEYKGKHFPCLTWWSKKGNITTGMLCYILDGLDNTQVFDDGCSKCIKPLLLADGHCFYCKVYAIMIIILSNYSWSLFLNRSAYMLI